MKKLNFFYETSFVSFRKYYKAPPINSTDKVAVPVIFLVTRLSMIQSSIEHP